MGMRLSVGARASLLSLVAILAAARFYEASAADLDGPWRRYGPPPPPAGFVVGVDARCRIIPQPQLDLVGETARFRPQAVCLSRGLYADSLEFPGAPVYYGGAGYDFPR